jgi:hypothetical protein
MIKHRLYQILLAMDQLFNALAFGWADETFSARCWRQRNKNMFWGFAYKTVDAVFFWDTKEGMKHCQWAFENEQKRVHMPVAYRVDKGAIWGYKKSDREGIKKSKRK